MQSIKVALRIGEFPELTCARFAGIAAEELLAWTFDDPDFLHDLGTPEAGISSFGILMILLEDDSHRFRSFADGIFADSQRLRRLFSGHTFMEELPDLFIE